MADNLLLDRPDWHTLFTQLAKIPGGYVYSGAASYQICFPLKAGGELRFMVSDEELEEMPEAFGIDFYDGALPPGISGFAKRTGEKT